MNSFQPDACKEVEETYKYLDVISEGVYGVVHRARDRKTQEIVALKRVKLNRTRSGFPIHSLREMNLLQELEHPNVIRVREVVVSKPSKENNLSHKVYLVMDYAHNDLYNLMQDPRNCNKNHIKQNVVRWTLPQAKCLILQLIKGMSYLHEMFVLHPYLPFFLKTPVDHRSHLQIVLPLFSSVFHL